MKKADVSIGGEYVAIVSGKYTVVRVDRESPYGGWTGTNLATGREIRIRSAQRLLVSVTSDSQRRIYPG